MYSRVPNRSEGAFINYDEKFSDFPLVHCVAYLCAGIVLGRKPE